MAVFVHVTPEIISISDLQKLLVSGFDDWKSLGEVSTATDGDLILFNYTNKAQYEGRWNFFERISRGIIINRVTGEIVARPFDKFFNVGERGEKPQGHIVTITEKIDGSMGTLYRLNGEYRIATRGAFHSEQAEWATAFLHEHHDITRLPDELTLIMEILYPANRVVIDYGGREELVLLVARNRHTGEYLPFFPDVFNLAQTFGFSTPRVFTFNNITEIIENTGTLPANEEGYVVEFSDGQRFKFKGDKYLELHRLISGLSFKHTLEAIQSGTVDYIRSRIPDEFLGQFNGWVATIESMADGIERAAKDAFSVAPKDNRKDFAQFVTANHQDLASYLFKLFDGKEIRPLIYKTAFRDFKDEEAVNITE